MFARSSASADKAHTNQQLPTCPCRMSSGRGSARTSTHGTVENWNVTSSRSSCGRPQPAGRSAHSSIDVS